MFYRSNRLYEHQKRKTDETDHWVEIGGEQVSLVHVHVRSMLGPEMDDPKEMIITMWRRMKRIQQTYTHTIYVCCSNNLCFFLPFGSIKRRISTEIGLFTWFLWVFFRSEFWFCKRQCSNKVHCSWHPVNP